MRRRLAERIDETLIRCGPDPIVAAVQRYAPEPMGVILAGGSERDAQRHLWALGHVLRLLQADLNGGGCPTCGGEHGGADCRQLAVLHLEPGECVACMKPGAESRPELPMKSYVCDDCWPGVRAELAALDEAA